MTYYTLYFCLAVFEMDPGFPEKKYAQKREGKKVNYLSSKRFLFNLFQLDLNIL